MIDCDGCGAEQISDGDVFECPVCNAACCDACAGDDEGRCIDCAGDDEE